MNKSKYTVLMVGPDASVKGGMRTVVDQYLSQWSEEDIALQYIPTYREGDLLRKMSFFVAQFLRIIFICLSRKIDVIHMHVSERGSFWRKALLLCVCRQFHIKTILHHHGAEFVSFYEKASSANQKRIEKIIEMADCNLVLSKYHYQVMRKMFPKGSFRVLYNAVSQTGNSGYNAEATGILVVGRLGQRKGTYDLVAALEEVEKFLSDEVKVYFCGDGDVEKIIELMRSKKLEHRVAHVGWCSKDQLKHFYGGAMLFILPSYHEGLPMSLLEAMYAGLPCITTNVDGIPEVITSGVNGLLVEPGNIEQIKTVLLQLSQDQILRKKLGENARQTVQQQFLLERHMKDLKTLYLEIKGGNHV